MGRHITGSVTPSTGGPGERFGVCASAGDANSASAKVSFLIPTSCGEVSHPCSQRYDIDDPALATAEADRSVTGYGEGYSRCSCMSFDSQDSLLAVIGVAIVIAVGEPCPDFSQIVRPDWLAAQHTERLRAGRPAIHQHESHVPPPFAVIAVVLAPPL